MQPSDAKLIAIVGAYTRKAFTLKVLKGGLTSAAGRELFFAELVGAICKRVLTGKGSKALSDRLVSSLCAESRSDFQGQALEAEVPEEFFAHPLALGWAYQVWNESIREDTAWGVSFKSERQREQGNLTVLTQLFTDRYIADFLVKRCLDLHLKWGDDKLGGLSVCDPALGTGHILVSVASELRARGMKAIEIARALSGFDIDPFAVALARVVLLLDLSSADPLSDPSAIWEILGANLRCLEAPLGTLDRGVIGDRYRVVVTNPPYLGRRKMSDELRSLLDRDYPDATIDISAAFMQRCVELVSDNGALGFVTSDKWLRLKGYRALREGGEGGFCGLFKALSVDAICELGSRAFHGVAMLHDGVKPTLMTAVKRAPKEDHEFVYRSFAEKPSYLDKVSAVERLYADLNSGETIGKQSQREWGSGSDASGFIRAMSLPEVITSGVILSKLADVVVGIQTNDDAKYVRYIWEVPPSTPGWRLHTKGGGYARWAGLERWVINWDEGADRFFSSDATRARAEEWIARAGWCYSWFANGSLGLRDKQAGVSFGRAASSAVFCDDERIAAVLNSRIASLATRAIGGKVQLPEGVVKKIALPRDLDQIDPDLVGAAKWLKRALLRGVPSEASFDPKQALSVTQSLAVQALLLVCEGVLEQQVEAAYGLSLEERNSLAQRYGPVVGWIGRGELGGAIASVLPAEFNFELELLKRVSESVNLSFQADAIDLKEREVLDTALKQGLEAGRVVNSKARFNWALPTTCLIEGVCREFMLNPIAAALLCINEYSSKPQMETAIGREWLFIRVLVEILESQGGGWWTGGAKVSGVVININGDLLRGSIETLGASGAVYGEGGLDSAKVALERDFGRWLDRIFMRRPPVKPSFIHF